MKQLTFLILMALATTGHGADFRLLDFGDSCSDIVAQETAVGSTLQMQAHGHYHFSNTHLGRAVTISYECRQGRMARGIFLFRFDDFSTAKAFFTREKANFMAYYGAPDLDQGSEGYVNRMAAIGFQLKDEHKHMLAWRQPARNILFGASRISATDDQAVVTIDIIPRQD